jgi:PAS domain S-box-containing protein
MRNQLPFTVLCVDDNPDNRLSVSLLLKQKGYRVLEAATGREALALAQDADLVILDVQLPDLSGFEVCQRLKANAATALVPVIFLSGHFTRSEDKAEGLEGGGDAYLTKAADPRELLGQVKALRRIREAELTLRQQAKIIDQIHDAVIATDLEGRVTQWSMGAERMFGYTAEEMLDQPVAVLDLPDQGERAFSQVLAAVQEGGGLERERRVRRKTGEEFYVHSSFSLLQDDHGNAHGIVGYSLDITEKRRLAEQHREAQRLEAIGQLAGGIAHDFNNLMTVVTGFAEIVLRNLSPDDPPWGLVQEIKRAGDRAAALTQQLLAFSRKQLLQLKVLDLNGLVREMENVLRQTMGGGVTVTICPDAPLGLVKVDPGQLRQAILNLAANAAEAMPNGGTFTVETRTVELDEKYARTYAEVQPGSYVLLAISDTGVGMDAATKGRIFEPFFTTKGEGSGGLGLAMVYGIVKQSGGHIEVESEVGSGTTFQVYLPRLN